MKNVIVLAAGKSLRMQSEKPKMLHNVLGKPIIKYIADLINEVGFDNKVIVVSENSKDIKAELEGVNIVFNTQKEQKGTADAVASAIGLADKKGETVIIMGDTPLVMPQTILNLIEANKNNDLTVLSAILPDGARYGRMVRGKDGKLEKIVEFNDATPDIKAIKEVNTGVYCIKNDVLFKFLPYLKNYNNRQENYFVDIIELLVKNNKKVRAHVVEDSSQFLGCNTREDLHVITNVLKTRINQTHMKNGVTIINADNTYIGPDVEIENDCTIYNNVHILGKTKIKSGTVIKPNSWVEDSVIGNNCVIDNSVIKHSEIDNDVLVGPFANIRKGTVLKQGSKIGAFVEVKNSVISENSKSMHHAYIGDASVGKNVNIGCGVIFANYNGIKKSHTIVNDNAFIGSNSVLVAPVTVGKGAFVAAGSTINLDVGSNDLAIARSFQVNKAGYAKKFLKPSGEHK